jgi:uncharacterized repeat protein (TIGR03803 family)
VFEIAKTAHGYASTPTTLVSFKYGTNGALPMGVLMADAHGDLFGTTSQGGAYGYGTVFEIAKTAHGYASTPTTLVNFNVTNGSEPTSGVIADAPGDLFAVTGLGRANGYGTVFEITGRGFSTHKTPSCTVVEANDQFVFDPNLGENPTINSNVHDETIDHFKSEFAQLAEHVLTQSHQDAVNPAFDAIDPMHDAVTIAAQHAHRRPRICLSGRRRGRVVQEPTRLLGRYHYAARSVDSHYLAVWPSSSAT